MAAGVDSERNNAAQFAAERSLHRRGRGRQAACRLCVSRATRSSSATAAALPSSNTCCPGELREFALYDLDLARCCRCTEVLDRAQTRSLMAPFQVFFVRNLKLLYGRGQHKEDFEAVARYAKDPNPDALVIFVADHIRIPADTRRMEMQDKDRYERIRETLGDCCTILEMARVTEADGVRWAIEAAAKQGVQFEAEAARELVDALGADMMLVANELEKLVLYVGDKRRITLGDVETLVLAAKQRSLYELTDAISAKDVGRALATLEAHARERRWRRRSHWAPLHARPHLPPDARHSRKERARFTRDLVGAVAGIPSSTVRRGGRHPPGPPLRFTP